MSDEGFFIDHVIYGCVDIDVTSRRLRDEYGLGAVPGGKHLGGTTNRFVPLGSNTFLELLGIGDTSKSDGAWLEASLRGQDRVLWWCLGVNDLDDTAARRGLPIQAGEGTNEDGQTITFRTAGMPRYPLPFFIALRGSEEERTRTWRERYAAAEHTSAPAEYTFVEVGDHEAVLDGWLGPDHGLPIRYAPGSGPGVHACGIATADGEIVIR